MKPNPQDYNPDPVYFRELVESTGLTQGRVAEEILGCSPRSVRMWLAGDRKFPYSVQYTLESHVLDVF